MKKDEFILMCDELLSEMFGKGNHYIWLSGRIETLKKLAEHFDWGKSPFTNIVLGWCEEEFREIAREFEEYKNSRKTYETFGG